MVVQSKADRLGPLEPWDRWLEPRPIGVWIMSTFLWCVLQWVDPLSKECYEMSKIVFTDSDVNSAHRNKQDGPIHGKLKIMKSEESTSGSYQF